MRGAAPALLLGGCGGVLDPQGPVGAVNRQILVNSLAVMLVVVVPTIVAALAFAWWFRASNRRATYRPEFTFSGPIELLVWSVPLLVILFLGGLIWTGSHRLDPYRPLESRQPPLEVQVVSIDWKWLFIYPREGVATVNRLVVPAGRPVHFSLTSASVMNAFFVPKLGSMVYTMYGMVTQLHLQADRPGTLYGRSTHFSGDGFPDMQFTVEAVPPAAFARWAAEARNRGPALDRRTYAILMRQGVVERPVGFGRVDPTLFHAIVTRALPPQPGPQTGKGGPHISPRSPEA